MCVICAAIPAAAAVGAKLNADQFRKEEAQRLPIPKIAGLVIGFSMIASTSYPILRWRVDQ
jgi:hypothetical protein